MKAMRLIVRAFLLANIDDILNEVVIQDAQLIVSEARKQAGGGNRGKHECGENLDEHCWEKAGRVHPAPSRGEYFASIVLWLLK